MVLSKVSKVYGRGEIAVHALRNVDFRVDRGDYLAIMGSSGSGKSTLMNLIGCLDAPTHGRYLLDRIDVSDLDDYELVVHPEPQDRPGLPELQPDPAHVGRCGTSSCPSSTRASAGPSAGRARSRRSPRSGSPTARCTPRRSSRAASSSAPRSRGRSSRSRRSCSPTSRPATSTARRRRRCSTSSPG